MPPFTFGQKLALGFAKKYFEEGEYRECGLSSDPYDRACLKNKLIALARGPLQDYIDDALEIIVKDNTMVKEGVVGVKNDVDRKTEDIPNLAPMGRYFDFIDELPMGKDITRDREAKNSIHKYLEKKNITKEFSNVNYKKFTEEGYVTEMELSRDIDLVNKKLKNNEFKNHTIENEAVRERLKLRKKDSEIIEWGLKWVLDKYDWFGGELSFLAGSCYDDLFSGADSVCLFKNIETNEKIGANIDLTIGSIKFDGFKKKFYYNFDNITKNKKTYIKYQFDENGEPMKEFVLPKIVLYIDHENQKLISLAVYNELSKIEYNSSEFDDRITENLQSLKFEILAQIIHQCQVMINYFESHDSLRSSSISLKYKALLGKINELGKNNPSFIDIIEKSTDFNTHGIQIQALMESYMNGISTEPKIK